MKKIILGILCILGLILLKNFFFETFFFSNSDELKCVPSAGKWYCGEIECTISFNHSEPISTIVIDGESVECVAVNERFTAEIFLSCQEYNNRKYGLSETVFSGTIVEFDETQFVLQESQTNTEYIFYRTD